MSRWKLFLLPLVGVASVLAYVVGVSTGAPEPPADPRPIVLDPSADGADGTDRPEPGQSAQRGGDDRDDRLVVVTPQPTTIRDDDGGVPDAEDDIDDDADDDQTDDQTDDHTDDPHDSEDDDD